MRVSAGFEGAVETVAGPALARSIEFRLQTRLDRPTSTFSCIIPGIRRES